MDQKKSILTFHKDVVFKYSVCMSCKFFASYCIDSLSDKCEPSSGTTPRLGSLRSNFQYERSSHYGSSKKSQRDSSTTVIVHEQDGSFSAQSELSWKEDTTQKPQAAEIFARLRLELNLLKAFTLAGRCVFHIASNVPLPLSPQLYLSYANQSFTLLQPRYVDSSFYLHPDSQMARQILGKVAVGITVP